MCPGSGPGVGTHSPSAVPGVVPRSGLTRGLVCPGSTLTVSPGGFPTPPPHRGFRDEYITALGGEASPGDGQSPTFGAQQAQDPATHASAHASVGKEITNCELDPSSYPPGNLPSDVNKYGCGSGDMFTLGVSGGGGPLGGGPIINGFVA